MLPGARTAALLLACALSSAASFAQLSFQSHAVAPLSSAKTHADFNGDGREDLVVSTSTGVSLLLSNGDGTYASPRALPASVDAIGDFNQDGKLDFISYRSGGGGSNQEVTPTLYLGNGDGTFQSGKVITGSGPTVSGDIFYLVAADLNNDGKTDFVTVEETYGTGSNGYPTIIQAWLSNGSGGFTKGQSITTEDPDPNNPNIELGGVYTGDFDGDGKPDLAINYNLFYGPDIVQVWYGDGAGHFTTSTYSESDYFAAPLIVADLNNDGKSDLISASETSFATRSGAYLPRLAVFSGNASRTLGVSYITPSGCVGSVAVADLNGDGINDLAYNVGSDCNALLNPNVVVRLGNGSGSFGAESTIAQGTYNAANLSVLRSTTGSRPDLVFTNLTAETPSYQNSVVLLTNNSTGNFPGCGLKGMAEGIAICSPGASSNSPVRFSVAAGGPTPMRTAAVWVDGKKVVEQLTHAFSRYSFLDSSLALAAGSHAIAIYATGWDNTLQKRSFTLQVAASGGACTAPASAGVNVCSPVNGSSVSSPVTVTAASTITGTLARMEVWVDGVKKYSETTSKSFTTSIALASGSHRFDVYAVNTAGTKWEKTLTATVK